MNQENKKQIIFAGVLGVVLVLVLVYQFVFNTGPATVPKAPAPSTTDKLAANTSAKPHARLKKTDVNLEELIEKVEPLTFRYEDHRIPRNPMTPLVGRIIDVNNPSLFLPASETSITQKTVTGIIYSEFEPAAIVDDELVSEGHQYADGVVLTKIEPKRVWFKLGDSSPIPVELKEL
tara:strand:+ start:786 stop:1316 length:531 start_codon:yes stop_codon:yes gene_type:complete